jgi:hypothetical protein
MHRRRSHHTKLETTTAGLGTGRAICRPTLRTREFWRIFDALASLAAGSGCDAVEVEVDGLSAYSAVEAIAIVFGPEK